MEIKYAGSPDHEPFHWQGADGAALLIHGFPGSPAEMRPLGKLIHAHGWTAEGLLLPGFGADIASLEKRRHGDWTEAVSRAVGKLRSTHTPIILIGYSVGGSVALATAVSQPVDAVAVLAPFWAIGNRWLDLAWPLIALLRPQLQLLKRIDFTEPEVRGALRRMFGEMDLNDLSVQEQIRSLSVPSLSLSEIRQLGKTVLRTVDKLDLPMMVVQGSKDPITLPTRTKQLLGRLPMGTHYCEVDAGHDLINPDAPAWAEICRAVKKFLDAVSAQHHER